MSSNNGSGYKPYTTPYTGTGSVKTDEGWVSLRDLGAPGAASGPGNRRYSFPPIPSFHHVELTTTNVTPPPPNQANHNQQHTSHDSKRTLGSQAHPSIITELLNAEIKGVEGHDGASFDLPEDHTDLSRISSRDIAVRIALLHLVKGNIHDEMQRAATDPAFLAREPREQFGFREEKAKRLREITRAIRAWEEVEDKRAENLFGLGLVDMLMISHDHQPARGEGCVSSSSSASASAPVVEREDGGGGDRGRGSTVCGG